MMQRVLLIVDDEENILRALGRLLRRDGYALLTAGSGPEALELLAKNPVGVIVSDQRMPGMTGSEFLERAKDIRPDSVRIMLSGYTDLQSVTDAINRGAIYRFLTKPWDDELLRDNIRQAFEQYELRAERDRLANELQAMNAQSAEFNQGRQQCVACHGQEIDQHRRLLELSREVLEHLPVGVLGVDDDGWIAVANPMATRLVGAVSGELPGKSAAQALPAALCDICDAVGRGGAVERNHVLISGASQPLTVHAQCIDTQSGCKGVVLVLLPEQSERPSYAPGDTND